MINIRQMLTQWLAENPGDPSGWPYMHSVIERLAGDPRAHDALNTIVRNLPRIPPTNAIWELIMDCCVHAKMQLETFHTLLAKERKTIERLQRHRQSVEDLRRFINEATEPHEHPMVDWMWLEDKTNPIEVAEMNRLASEMGWAPPSIAYQKGADYYLDALNRIAVLIDERQQSTDRAMLRFGVNRKSRTKEAAETAAIGWLAEQVEDIFGKPFARQVAVLAEVALNIAEVSEDRVREALKSRRRQSVDSTTK